MSGLFDDILPPTNNKRSGGLFDDVFLQEEEERKRREQEKSGFFSGLGSAVAEGAEKTYRSARAALSTYLNIGDDVVTQAGETARIEKDSRASDLKALKQDIQQRKLFDDDSIWSGIKNVAGAVVDNPRGAAQLVAEQAPNSAVSLGSGLAGAKGGALVGSAFGPVGTAVGGTVGFLAGLFGANALLETGGKAIEASQDKQFTPEERSQAIREGTTKGAVITAVDAATLGASKFVLGAANRAVEQATVRTLSDAGVDAAKAAASIRQAQREALEASRGAGRQATQEAVEKATVDAMGKAGLLNPDLVSAVQAAQKSAFDTTTTLGKRAGRGGAALGLESFGEGFGEGLGEYAATGEFSPTEAVLESVAGLSMSLPELYVAKQLDAPGELTSAYSARRPDAPPAPPPAPGALEQLGTATQDLEQSVTSYLTPNDVVQSTSVDEAIAKATELAAAPLPSPTLGERLLAAEAPGLVAQQLEIQRQLDEQAGLNVAPSPARAELPPIPVAAPAPTQRAIDRETQLLEQRDGTPANPIPERLRLDAQRREEAAGLIESNPQATPEILARATALRNEAQSLRTRADEIATASAATAQPAAGTQFEREQLDAQAAVNREMRLPERESAAAKYADLTPMTPLQARQRLVVLQDQSGQPLSLEITPHPSQKGAFAIAERELLSAADLEISAPAPAPVSAAEAQNRIESAELGGREQRRKRLDEARQIVVTRALKNVEERGGVASPQEAQIFQEANLGRPYDSIDESLGPKPGLVLPQMEERGPATTGGGIITDSGVSVGRADRQPRGFGVNASLDFAPTGLQATTSLGAAPDTRVDGIEPTGLVRAFDEPATTGGRSATKQSEIPAMPGLPGVADTLNVNAAGQVGATESQNQTLLGEPSDTGTELAKQRVAAGYQAAAPAPAAPRPSKVNGTPTASLTSVQLTQMAGDEKLPAITRRGAQIELGYRASEVSTAAPAATAAAPATTALPEPATPATPKLDQARPGVILTSNAKMSSARPAAPGATGTLNDNGTQHTYTVVDPGKLGTPGKMISQVARIFGKKLVVFESDTLQSDGFVLDDDSTSVYLNAKSSVSPLAVFGHEMVHLLKRDNAPAYAALEAVVQRNVDAKGMERFQADYGKGANLEELASDLTGNRFQEPEFWTDVFNELAAQNPTGARAVILKVAAALNKAVNAFKRAVSGQGFNADQYVKDLDAVKAAVKSAVVQYAQQQREPAMRMEAELMRAESQVNLTAGSSSPASVSQAAPAQAGATAAPTPAAPTRTTAAATSAEDELAEVEAQSARFSRVRSAVPEETEISTQNPQAVNRLYNPIDDMLSIDEAAVREAMALPVKSGKTPLAESITNAILGYGFVPRDTPRDKVIEVYKQSIVSNLMYLFGKVPKSIRERSKLWYDGANRIATDMGKAYGVKMEQVAGIMAAMSPQKDWFQNVSMAERALDILTRQGNKAWDDNMLAYAKSYVEETRDRKEREKRQKAYDKAVDVAKAGTVLNDMNEDDAAVFIRSYDEAYHSRQYRIVTPEGGFGDLVRNADGTPSTMMWSTYDPIVKSVSIFRDGSRKNISEQLGEEHKIRSFYNNIAAPNSPISHVTIDTHAVAAGHFEALAGTDKEVTDNFGGTGGSSLLGVGGTYGIVADAYRTAAQMAGVSAREMQSITWEAVRGLFGENIKSSIKPKVREVWSQFRDGKLSFAAARRAIVKIAEGYNKTKGGILNPDWVGSGPGQAVADGGTSYDKSFVPEGGVRLRESKELREKVTINLSAATSSIPGLKELYARALDGEVEATQLLQQVAESSLRFLLGGTKARLVVAPSTGVYMSDREPSISIQVAFDESESKPVLAALAAFADSYNQQQIHVRVPTIQPLGHEFGDGSYATPVYEIDLRQELTPDDISAIIVDSGLKGFTVTPKTLTAYWVQSTDETQDGDDFKTFAARIARVQALAGQGGGRPRRTVERLYAYGEGDGARVPYSAIRGDVRTKADSDLETPRLIAEYLNKGPVRTFAQKPLTAAQTKEQKQLAQIFEALPSNDLQRPTVRQAYDALASALKEQFQVLPIKVEVMASVEIDGKAYPYWGPKAQTLVGKLVDEGMAADQARRALQYLQRNYGAPSKSWKSGPLSKVKAMDGEPYANSAEMRRDVSVNNRFRVYKTAPATFGPPGSDFSAHPLLQDSGLKDANGYPMLYNDLLRAVHDYFAHNLSATQFGPTGEAAAWRNHMASTQDPMARWALTAETRLQNAWQNFRPGAEKLTVAERGFAEQKAALPPVQYALTGDAAVDAPMQAFIEGLPEQDRRGSLPPDVKIKGAQLSRARKRSAADISIGELQGRQVSMPVRVEDTGETGTLTMDAGDSLADINEREAAMQRLLECLRK